MCVDILNEALQDMGKIGLRKAFQIIQIHFLKTQGRLSTVGLKNRWETNPMEAK